MTTNAETYFSEGCGRCALGGTPDCKVHTWQRALQALRQIVLACELREECKWGMPCYTFQGKNVLMLAAFKDNCTISFFKGALLHDEYGLLENAGENSHVAKLIRFTAPEQVWNHEEALKNYIYQAIEVEKAGLKVPKSSAPDIPEELQQKFEAIPGFQEAFEALTPGRQRGYLLHFTGAKQAATRTARIEKWMPLIFAGKGMMD
jgi:uncharacterized protein YdeI (YjbR/CyaY-like superfamily)